MASLMLLIQTGDENIVSLTDSLGEFMRTLEVQAPELFESWTFNVHNDEGQ